MTEQNFLAEYNPNDYPAMAFTSDIALMTIRNGRLCVLLVERAGHPYQGYWALPGGFVGLDEDSETAAMREMQEETGINLDFGAQFHKGMNLRQGVPMTGKEVLEAVSRFAERLFENNYPAIFRVHERDLTATRGVLEANGYDILVNPSEEELRLSRSLQQIALFEDRHEVPAVYKPLTVDTTVHLEQLKTYSAPDRDPRMRVISTAYVAIIPDRDLQTPKAGSDARRTQWFAVHDLLNPRDPKDAVELAFDHQEILTDALHRVQNKMGYSPLATAFVDDTFTIADLRSIYEEVWGLELHEANFRRKMLSVQGLLEEVGEKGESMFEGGRSANLYRRGTAQEIYPEYRMRDATRKHVNSQKIE